MGEWISNLGWFLFGAAVMGVLIFALAPVMLSSQISQAQERAGRDAMRREGPPGD